MSLFTSQGKPFFPLGGQSNNSSAYNKEELASAIAGTLALGGNTLEAPIYWEQIEPMEGEFDFTAVDEMFRALEKVKLKLIILWFATWKNGEMRYVPEWVKMDTSKFIRVTSYIGTQMNVLSSHCPSNLEADKKAFCALIEHIKKIDPKQNTLLAIQVQNEPGILGSDRDYSPNALSSYKKDVPIALMEYIIKHQDGEAYKIWSKNGKPQNGDWESIFGIYGGELHEAYSIAKYIDTIAKAGKEIFDLPMSVNVWLGSTGWQIPGFYPSGGPVKRVIDIWKYATTSIDVIAPDIYDGNFTSYLNICNAYTRDDNPLYVPESGANDQNAFNMLRAIALYDCEGYFVFAIDSVLNSQGDLVPSCRTFAHSFTAVNNLKSLLLKYRGTGKIHAIVQEPHMMMQQIEFENYFGAAFFGGQGGLYVGKDHRYYQDRTLTGDLPYFGLIIEVSPGEFYMAGHMHMYFAPKKSPDWNHINKGISPTATPVDYLSVDEGYLDDEGVFIPTRRRNGDEVVFGSFWASPQCGVVRIRLNIN